MAAYPPPVLPPTTIFDTSTYVQVVPLTQQIGDSRYAFKNGTVPFNPVFGDITANNITLSGGSTDTNSITLGTKRAYDIIVEGANPNVDGGTTTQHGPIILGQSGGAGFTFAGTIPTGDFSYLVDTANELVENTAVTKRTKINGIDKMTTTATETTINGNAIITGDVIADSFKTTAIGGVNKVIISSDGTVDADTSIITRSLIANTITCQDTISANGITSIGTLTSHQKASFNTANLTSRGSVIEWNQAGGGGAGETSITNISENTGVGGFRFYDKPNSGGLLSHTAIIGQISDTGLVALDGYSVLNHLYTADLVSSGPISGTTLTATGAIVGDTITANTSLAATTIIATGPVDITGAVTTGNLIADTILSNGTMSCGTNALTSGAITSSGAFTCGTNAATTGALSCASLTSAGTLSATTVTASTSLIATELDVPASGVGSKFHVTNLGNVTLAGTVILASNADLTTNSVTTGTIVNSGNILSSGDVSILAGKSLKVTNSTDTGTGEIFQSGNTLRIYGTTGDTAYLSVDGFNNNTELVGMSNLKLNSATLSGGSINTGSVVCSTINASGAFTCGTNAATTGALSCASLTSSGTVSCGSNSLTCGTIISSKCIGSNVHAVDTDSYLTIAAGTNYTLLSNSVSVPGAMYILSGYNKGVDAGAIHLVFGRDVSGPLYQVDISTNTTLLVVNYNTPANGDLNFSLVPAVNDRLMYFSIQRIL